MSERSCHRTPIQCWVDPPRVRATGGRPLGRACCYSRRWARRGARARAAVSAARCWVGGVRLTHTCGRLWTRGKSRKQSSRDHSRIGRMEGRRRLPGTLLPPNAHSVCLPHPAGLAAALSRAAAGRPLGVPAAMRDAGRVAAPSRGRRGAPHTPWGRPWQRNLGGKSLWHSPRIEWLVRWRRHRTSHRLRMEGRRRPPGTLLPPNAHSVCLPHPAGLAAALSRAAAGRPLGVPAAMRDAGRVAAPSRGRRGAPHTPWGRPWQRNLGGKSLWHSPRIEWLVRWRRHRTSHRLRMEGRRRPPGTLLPPNAHSVCLPHPAGLAAALSRAAAGRPLGVPAATRDAGRVAAPSRGRRGAPHTPWGRPWPRNVGGRSLWHSPRIEWPVRWRRHRTSHRLRMEGRRRLPGTLLPPNAHSVCLPHPGWCSAPVHPQSVDDGTKGNVDASAARHESLEKRADRRRGCFRRT